MAMTAVDTVRGEPGPEKMARIGHGCPVDVAHRPGRPPRVSVIVPTYNRAQMVCACVDSVLKSDWPDFEVIVADDCSMDAALPFTLLESPLSFIIISEIFFFFPKLLMR